MKAFLARFASEIKGVLSGFDRIRFRGTVRWLSSKTSLSKYLDLTSVRLKDFKGWAMGQTNTIKQTTENLAAQHGQAVHFLQSCNVSKERIAQEIAQAKGIDEGLICILSCTESCHTFEVGPNRAQKKLELRAKPGRCLHYYFYLQHRQYGLMHLRLQTWAPFTIHVCLNGRDWLGRELTQRNIPHIQRDNCFVDVGDVALAQQLLDEQRQTDWNGLLNNLRQIWHPAHATMFPQPLDYYWSAEETEWATDVLFRSEADLARVYPTLLRHAITTFSSQDVLRFLGRSPKLNLFRTAEILSSLKGRPEGTRVKHSLNGNSVKMYDKQNTVLRVETTINNPKDMKSFRTAEGDPEGKPEWRRLRKGVADLHRRTEISQQCNERYLESLSAVETPTPLAEVVKPICQPVTRNGRRVRALEPLGETDGQLLEIIAQGEFAINGFRNRDLRALLYPEGARDPATAKRQAARVTRLLGLLRGHGLIKKVPKTHRYQLTSPGRTITTAVLIAKQMNVKQLAELAA